MLLARAKGSNLFSLIQTVAKVDSAVTPWGGGGGGGEECDPSIRDWLSVYLNGALIDIRRRVSKRTV